MVRGIFVVIAVLGILGCWSMKANNMANQLDNDGSLKLCLFNKGVEPEALVSCIRNSSDQAELKACIPQEKRKDVEGCILQAQAEIHKTDCYKNPFGGESCRSN